jgi:hypothetical protein
MHAITLAYPHNLLQLKIHICIGLRVDQQALIIITVYYLLLLFYHTDC